MPFSAPWKSSTTHPYAGNPSPWVDDQIREEWKGKRPVRLIGVGVSGIGKPFHQLGLWDKEWQKEEKRYLLRQALAALRERFGENIVHQGPPPSREDKE